jgi:hypothetical protein
MFTETEEESILIWNTRATPWHKYPKEKPVKNEGYWLYNSMCRGFGIGNWNGSHFMDYEGVQMVDPTHYREMELPKDVTND